MSRWTHVSGALSLSASVYNFAFDWDAAEEKRVIPKPKEQIKICPAFCSQNWSKNCLGLGFIAEVSALPRIRDFLEKQMKEFFPRIDYIIYNIAGDCDSSSNTGEEQEEDEIKEAVVRLYKNHPFDSEGFSWFELEDYYNAFIDSIQYNSNCYIPFNANIRDCSGEDLTQAFTNFLTTLLENEIHLNNCTVRWYDEYNNSYYYELVCGPFDGIKINIHDLYTSTILAYRKICLKDGEVVVTDTDGWKGLKY